MGHLKEIFGHYGRVKDVDLPVDRRNGIPRSYATISFDDEKEAEQAMFHLDGGQIDGNAIKVSFVLVQQRKVDSPPAERSRVQQPPPHRRSPPPSA
ncbi:hypothetical protein EON64_19000, partial [archaeon]